MTTAGRETPIRPPDVPGRPFGEAGRLSMLLLVAAVAVFALNLRPAIVAVGPLTDQLRADTGLGAAAVSLLTTLPLLCFGAFSMVAPRLSRRVGLEPALAIAAVLLIGGCALRLLPPVATLFLGAGLAGIGIAIGNVLVPVVVKRDFPHHTGPMMALYSAMLNLGAALAAALSVPLGRALNTDWRQTLALWGVFAVLALLLWIPQLLHRAQHVGAGPDGEGRTGVWRSPLAWAVAIFMGMQSLVFYSLAAWLPTLLQDHGMSEAGAGLMVSIVSFCGIGVSLVVPVLAVRAATQTRFILFCVGSFALGLIGLLIAPVELAVLWMVALGLGAGTGISLAVTLFVLRSRTTRCAADLSGMAQAVGYTIAAAGPLLVGTLHGVTGGWNLPLFTLGAFVVVILVAGRIATEDRYVEDDLQPV
ncbi:MAG TPA: MFS transporter [Solirubrobacterales bacterium]|nr:MFS transporter [Solirubrobacterales bacterium]